MEELKSNEETVVKLTTVITAAREPGADGGFTDAEYFFEGGNIDAQGEQMECRTNCLGISLQAIQDRVLRSHFCLDRRSNSSDNSMKSSSRDR